MESVENREAPRLLSFPTGAGDLVDKLGYAAVRVVGWPIGLLPYPLARLVGRTFGALGFYLMSGRRRVGEVNLDLAYGDRLSRSEKRRILRSSFRNTGETAVSFFWSSKLNAENHRRFVTMEGAEIGTALHAQGRGLIALVPHLGNWELMTVAAGFLPVPIHIITHRIKNPYLNDHANRIRIRTGNDLIFHDDAVAKTFRALRDGECVGIVFDQNTHAGRGGIFVDFFGVEAGTSRAAAAYALATGAAVCLVRALPLRGARGPYHHVVFGPEIPVEKTGDWKRDVYENTRRFNAVIEQVVRETPEYWMWTHRRFKSRPVGEAPLYT